MKLYESIKNNLNETDENLQDIYYFLVGICLDENRPDADKDEFYDMSWTKIPYKLADENYGCTQTLDEALSYVKNYVESGVPGTFGVVTEAKEPFAGFKKDISGGFNDGMEFSDIRDGSLVYSAYSTKDKGIITVVGTHLNDSETVKEAEGAPDITFAVCYNGLDVFPSKKAAMDFYKDCMYASEGSEKERYVNVYMGLTDGNDVGYDGDDDVVRDITWRDKAGNKISEEKLDAFKTAEEVIRGIKGGKKMPPKEFLNTLEEAETLKEGTFGEEVGFSEYADIEGMKEEVATKLLNALYLDPSWVEYTINNYDPIQKMELHRGTSWTDNNAWLVIDATLPDYVALDYIKEHPEEYPTLAKINSTDDLRAYEIGVEMGRHGGHNGFYDTSVYMSFDVTPGYYSELSEEEANAMDKNIDAEGEKLEKKFSELLGANYQNILDTLLANEYVEEAYWEELDSKQVPDSDGFMTDYTLYTNNAGSYVCIFGDKDVYTPEDGDYDWEGETEEEAREWFNNYEGFNESEKLKEYEDIYVKIQGVELGKNEYAEFVEKIKEGKNYLCKPYKIYKLDYDEGTDKVNTTLVYEKPKTEHGVPIVSRGHYILANEEYARSLSDNQLKESSYNREDGKTDEQVYEEYVTNEQKLADEYKNKLIAEINDERIKKFNELKSMLNEKKHGSDLIGGFWIPTDFRYALEGTDGHHLNSYMDLTVEDIFNMIEGNSSIEEALNELFEDYKADSAYSWGDNFLYALDKANPNAYEETLDRYEEEYEDEELNESEENSTLADLVHYLQEDAEQYDEAMLDDEDDVFGGTEDSYANEMLDQHVSDTIFYNDLFKGVDYGVLTDIISEVIDSIVAGGAMSESYVKHLLKKYNINPKNPIKKEAETITIPKEIVDKVRAEYDEAKPEIIKEIKKEFASFLRYAKKYYSEEELKETSTYKAYQDAIKDPEDIWCECGAPNGESYKEDGDSYLGVEKHGYVCNDCGKFVQIG